MKPKQTIDEFLRVRFAEPIQGYEMSLDAIAYLLGTTRAKVYEIEQTALRKLRWNLKARELL